MNQIKRQRHLQRRVPRETDRQRGLARTYRHFAEGVTVSRWECLHFVLAGRLLLTFSLEYMFSPSAAGTLAAGIFKTRPAAKTTPNRKPTSCAKKGHI